MSASSATRASSPRGRFLTIEGPDGVGKTTQVRLLAERLRRRGYEVVCTREPGGTRLGEELRKLILPREDSTNTLVAEVLLLNAARAQLVAEVIAPALARGAVVVADRYADATLAYQGYGRGGDRAMLRTVIAIATGGLWPDRTVLLDVPPSISLDRLASRGADNFLDRADPDFRRRVYDGFRALALEEPTRWSVVDGRGDPDDVAGRVWAAVDGVLPGR